MATTLSPSIFLQNGPTRINFKRILGNSIECSRIDFNGQIEMMLRDFLRYPGVFKKSVRGKMCLFYRYLKLCPRENSLKTLPEGAIF